ncbi:hypothetical protein ABK040_002805 [Willaertia magna]
MSKNKERFVECYKTDNNLNASLYFRFVKGKLSVPNNQYRLVRSEIVVDNYFQLEPICTVEKGNWPKTRVKYLVENNLNIESNTALYASNNVGKESNLTLDVVEFKSNFELVQHILKIKGYVPQKNKGLSQEFFTNTIILRHIFEHKEDSNVVLHICALKLGNGLYHNFGKLKISGNEENITNFLLQRFEELNHGNTNAVPTHRPVIQKLLFENSTVLNDEDFEKYLVDKNTLSSISSDLEAINNTDENLITSFKYME